MSYQEFKNQVLGKTYDIDGYYGAQCWDGYAKYCMYLGVQFAHCTSSGYVKDIWNLRGSNGILNYFDEVSVMQPGDVAVFYECSSTPYSHIAIFDSDAGGGYGNFLGQNQGGAGGAFNIVRLPYSATFATAFRPKNSSNAGGYDPSQLIPEKGRAYFRNDVPITIRRDSPTGPSFGSFAKGEYQDYTEKWIGNGHRYISFLYEKDPSIRCFAAVSGTESRPVAGSDDEWATFGQYGGEETSPPDPEEPVKEFLDSVKYKGVDISEHNGNIDISSYDFVIIRAAYGTNTDNNFIGNVKKCIEAKKPFGVYLYDYALNDDQALEQASYLYNLLKEHDIAPDLGVWFDMEDADGYKNKNGVLNKERCTKNCKIFCDYFKERGYYVGIYSSSSWLENMIEETGYPKWIANWGTNDGTCQGDFSNEAVMHQYTSSPIDKNVMYVEMNVMKSDPIEVEEPDDKPEVPVFPELDVDAINAFYSNWAKIAERILG